jgi:hypothetical protein
MSEEILSKDEIVNMYLLRDLNMNLEARYMINKGLKKLGYLNYNELNKKNDRMLTRSIQLSKFVDSNDIREFYNALTLDELEYIGY